MTTGSQGTETVTAVDEGMWMLHGATGWRPSWSGDNRWLAYRKRTGVDTDVFRLGQSFDSLFELFSECNTIGGRHGLGMSDQIENRVIDAKSRGIYETPGGTVLHVAHRALESITMDREVLHLRDGLIPRYASLIYNGFWFSPEMELLQKTMDEAQKTVNGTVRLKLYKGNVSLVGRKSPFSLYREDFATFGEEDVYNQQDAHGFIQLFGLPMKVEALLSIDGGENSRYIKPDYSKFKRD